MITFPDGFTQRHREVATIICESYIWVELPKDFDSEEANHVAQETWEHAMQFLVDLTHTFFSERDQLVSAPKIDSAAEKGIDLFWQAPHFDLLVHITAAPECHISYCGWFTDERETRFKGVTTLSNPEVLHEALTHTFRRGD